MPAYVQTCARSYGKSPGKGAMGMGVSPGKTFDALSAECALSIYVYLLLLFERITYIWLGLYVHMSATYASRTEHRVFMADDGIICTNRWTDFWPASRSLILTTLISSTRINGHFYREYRAGKIKVVEKMLILQMAFCFCLHLAISSYE